jgi:hypothetical protein
MLRSISLNNTIHVAPVAIFRWIWSLMLVRPGLDGKT